MNLMFILRFHAQSCRFGAIVQRAEALTDRGQWGSAGAVTVSSET